jgi:hypothetical protein
MDLAVIIAAAEHAASAAAAAAAEHEAHKSETPFFVVGGLWAVFAVVISVYGFRRPEFPATASAARGVMAAGVVFWLSAVGTAVYVGL